jgi:hypothetical protein
MVLIGNVVMEMRMVIAALITRYDIHISPPELTQDNNGDGTKKWKQRFEAGIEDRSVLEIERGLMVVLGRRGGGGGGG